MLNMRVEIREGNQVGSKEEANHLLNSNSNKCKVERDNTNKTNKNKNMRMTMKMVLKKMINKNR